MSTTLTIVVADDDPSTITDLQPILSREGFTVYVAEDGLEALRLTREHDPDVLILDVEMPRRDGRSVCRDIRATGNDRTSIIMLTQYSEPGDTVASLNEGADDYVPKPYDPHVLVARIRAVARRGQRARSLREAQRLTCKGLRLDRMSRQVHVHGTRVELHNLEFRLLEFLMLNQGRVFTRAELLDRVWQSSPAGMELRDVYLRRVDKQASALRVTLAKYAPGHDFIGTRRGDGYYFIEAVEAG
jgi:DNA-binding response OmpR family regulator